MQSEDFAALLQAIEALTDEVRVLRQAVDDLTSEVQYANNNSVDGDIARPSFAAPFRLRSMSKDPAAENWTVNAVDESTVDRLRNQLVGATQNAGQRELF